MTPVTAWIAAHRKLVVVVVGAALTLALQVWGPDNQWVSLAVLAATSLGVYGAPNTPPPGPSAAHPARRVNGGTQETAMLRTVPARLLCADRGPGGDPGMSAARRMLAAAGMKKERRLLLVR